MANETTYSSTVTKAADVDASILEAFLAQSVMAGLVRPFNLSDNTNAHKLPKGGSLTAAVVSESSAATPQTLTDTSVTLTIQKAVVVTKPTAEAEKFTRFTAVPRHLERARIACMQKFDVDACALSAGFSTSVDSGATATIAKVHEAAYNLHLNNIVTSSITAVLHPKQIFQIEGDIRTSGNAIYGNPGFSTSAVSSDRPRPGFKGNIMGINIFQTTNVYTDTGATPDDYVGMVFAPAYAIAALYPKDAGNLPQFETSIAYELGFLESVSFIKSIMWYQLGEYNDLAGIGFKSDI